MKLRIKGTDSQKAKQYPDMGDQLDALWKIVTANNLTIPQESSEMVGKIQKVKSTLKQLKFSEE